MHSAHIGVPSKIVLWWLLAVALVAGAAITASALEPPLQLDINEQKTLELNRFSAIYAADRNVVAVRALPGNQRVILTGVGEGTTSITIAYPGGQTETRRIRVVSQTIAVDDLELLIGDILGIEMIQVGSRIAVRGAVRTSSEWNRYRKVVERFDNVIDLVENLTTRTNVQLDVKVFELSRSGMQELGLEWFQSLQSFDLDFSSEPRGLQYSFSPPGGGLLFGEETLADLTTPVTVGKMSRLSPLLVELRALEDKGYARLLAKPQIVAENGGKARFQVGGRLPYPVENGQGAISVDFQEYGTIVEVEPRIISAHTLALVIHAEVSEPDYANTVMNTPGIRAREASTSVQIREGETLAIAGLLSHSEAEGRRGLPLPVVAKIPLVGRLFGSDRSLFDEIETLILVTPHVLTDGGSTVGRETLNDLERFGELQATTTAPPDTPEGW